MGHDICDRRRYYWTRTEQFFTPFYPNTMTHNDKEMDHNDEKYDRLWKIRETVDTLNVAYSKFYNAPERLATDDVIVLFKLRVVFKQHIPKKHKRFAIKIFKLCDAAGYTYDMQVYLGKDRQCATTDMTATHATVKQLTRRAKGRGPKLHMHNYFSSPDLYNDVTKQKTNCCRRVRPNRTGMPHDFRSKTLRLRRGDVRARTNGDLTAVVWKDKRNVHMLTNIHVAPAEGNFCNEWKRPEASHCGGLQSTHGLR
ncbi:hypothetical protein Cfor_12401 [Coptotermes formosanus]|uniref:PiggyBac transposable element-derived protein domain-containing protein n=1 Tax=Coptotermes formosanus TaxID=36987 RepID=A0A6L2PLI0_COPFO|nr:hypothetical protein Cfor_12401 [Coptotermes formosanus]